MVKKIDGTKGLTGGASSVERSQATGQTTGAGKISNVEQVDATQAQGRAGAIRRPTRPMTNAEREMLFKLIEEEAEKLAAEGLIPAAKKPVVKEAVKLTVDASLIEDEE